jgi:putative radical SAM enzyme (TIGR03279 family)
MVSGFSMIRGVKVRHVPKESPFYKAGLRSSDIITSINGEEVTDELDFRFFAADCLLELSVRRGDADVKLTVIREEGSFLDVDIQERPINTCKNRCIFCFIDQMPPGLRSGLYIKDEDFKYSFLNGNYVTLSSTTRKDLEKVARLGISPLFISVHATETGIRNKMLRNSKAPPVMDQLNFLKNSGVAFHTQIVVCKGYNDGNVLLRTLEDLFSFGENLLSIAVVPVGLTRYRNFPLEPVDSQTAGWICSKVEQMSLEHLQKDGFRKLFLADEFFIKAGLKIPPAKYYEDYPQIENGVGLVRMLLEQWKTCKSKLNSGKSRISFNRKTLLLTSVSAYPYLKRIISEAEKQYGVTEMDIVAVKNDYFGETVTVAGLLTAKDIISTIKRETKNKKYGQIIIPAVMFNFGGYTLDGFSLQRICKATGIDIKIAESPEEVFCVKKGKR